RLQHGAMITALGRRHALVRDAIFSFHGKFHVQFLVHFLLCLRQITGAAWRGPETPAPGGRSLGAARPRLTSPGLVGASGNSTWLGRVAPELVSSCAIRRINP